jgi:hypothetical protein
MGVEQHKMRINITHPLVWLLATWILSAGSLLFPVSPSVADSTRQVDAHHLVESAVPVSLPPAHGADDRNPIPDDDSVLDDQDFYDKTGSTSSGFEDTQNVAPVVFFQLSRAATTIHAAHFESRLQVEPRFLRYARLLN